MAVRAGLHLHTAVVDDDLGLEGKLMSTPVPAPHVLLLTRADGGLVGYQAILAPDNQAVVPDFTGSDLDALDSAEVIVIPSDPAAQPLRVPVSSAVVIRTDKPLCTHVIVSLSRSVADIPPIPGTAQQIQDDLDRVGGDYGAWLGAAVGPIVMLAPKESRPVPPVDYSSEADGEFYHKETYGSVTILSSQRRQPPGCPWVPKGPCR